MLDLAVSFGVGETKLCGQTTKWNSVNVSRPKDRLDFVVDGKIAFTRCAKVAFETSLTAAFLSRK